MNSKKKAIGPVVATALLIVVAVVAVIGFQNWFGMFSSQVFVDTESKSNSNLDTGLDSVIGNKLYFKNSNNDNLSIKKIKIDGIDCNISGNYSGSIVNIDVSSCVGNLTTKTPEIVVYTDDKVYSKKEYFREIQVSQSGSETTLIINNLLLTSGPLSSYGTGTSDDSARNVKIDGEGNIYIVGDTKSDLDFGNGVNMTFNRYTDFFLVKYDSNGVAQFVKTSINGSGQGYDYAYGVDVDSNGNIYVVGYVRNDIDFGNGVIHEHRLNEDFFLVKYNSSGAAQFVKSSEGGTGNSDDRAYDVVVDNDDNVYVVGKMAYSLDFGNGVSLSNAYSVNFFIVKYNSAGVPQFAKTSVSNDGNIYANKIVLDNSGNIYVVGYNSGNLDFGNGVTLSNDGSYDFFLVKYNNAGVPQFAKSSEGGSGVGYDVAADVTIDDLGNIYLVGYSGGSLDFGNGINFTNDEGWDFFLVRYDSSGVAQFIKTGGLSSGYFGNKFLGISLDSLGNIYVIGSTDGDLDFDNGVTLTNDGERDFFLVKYNDVGVAQFIKTTEDGHGFKDDEVFGINIDNDDNVYIVGESRSSLNFGNGVSLTNDGWDDFFLTKYNSAGVAQFAKSSISRIGTTSDKVEDIALDDNYNMYVTGYTKSDLDFGNGIKIENQGGDDFYLVKYNGNGVAQFIKTSELGSGYEGDYGKNVEVDSAGNIYVGGHSSGDLNFGNGVSLSNDGNNDFFLVKYNNAGIPQFVKTSEFGSGVGTDSIEDVFVDNVGNIYLVGYTSSDLNFGNGVNISNDGGYDFFLVKFDSSGVAQFAKTGEAGTGTEEDKALGVFVDINGNIYVVGHTRSSLDFGNGVSFTNDAYVDYFLVKYNSAGIAQFVKSTEGSSGEMNDYACGVNVDSNGNIYVAGYSYGSLDFGNGVSLSNDADFDFFLVKYDSTGVAQFAKSSESGSGSGYDSALDISVDNQSNIYLVGSTKSNLDFGNGISLSNDGESDFFLVQYDSSGVAQFVKTSENNSGVVNDYIAGVELDKDNNVYIYGSTQSSLDFGNGSTLINTGETDFYIYRYVNITN